ncbi:hypothetical protein [Burkholderia stagnalis]|uniref:hypothetical protein n=1 Tax=Burkholderia stagnalis TaxID=1503054 RepID=UPI0012D89EAF|nr:hypothetical protein [Burkholderia stagnalis]
MIFSKKCDGYISAHSCTESEERCALDFIRKALPVSSSAIDWKRIVNKEEVNDVDRAHLADELTGIANSMGVMVNDVFYVINVDDAFPVLKTRLLEWLRFSGELDFVDTIFVSESKRVIIHWDFYKNLHATIV